MEYKGKQWVINTKTPCRRVTWRGLETPLRRTVRWSWQSPKALLRTNRTLIEEPVQPTLGLRPTTGDKR